MSTPLTLIATLTANPAQQAAVEAGLRELVDASRREDGCLQYDLHRHQDHAHVFVMIEQWRDEQALAAHQQTPHFLHFGQTCGEHLQAVDHQLMHRL